MKGSYEKERRRRVSMRRMRRRMFLKGMMMGWMDFWMWFHLKQPAISSFFRLHKGKSLEVSNRFKFFNPSNWKDLSQRLTHIHHTYNEVPWSKNYPGNEWKTFFGSVLSLKSERNIKTSFWRRWDAKPSAAILQQVKNYGRVDVRSD